MQIRTWIHKNVGLGLLLSIVICVGGAALGAILESREILTGEGERTWICAVWLFAALAGSRAALRKTQQGRIFHALAQAALLYIAVWGAALTVGSDRNFGENGWYITICIVAGSALAAMLPEGRRRPGKKKGKARKRRRKGRQ